MNFGSLFKNLISLGGLQIANYVFPLLTLPYLIRVLGVENFGHLSYANTLVSYSTLIINYGFDISGTREISINRDNSLLTNNIFNEIITSKLYLYLISLSLFSFYLFYTNSSFQNNLLIFIIYLGVFGQIIMPAWFFQGVEKMKYITYFNLISKFFFTLMLFIFVKDKGDILIAAGLTTLGSLIAGVSSVFLLYKTFKISFKLVRASRVFFQIKKSFHFFVSGVGVHFYKNNAILLIKHFGTATDVGYFSIVRKVFEALNGLNSILSQAFLPLTVRDQANSNKSISKSIKLLFIVIFLTSFLLFSLTFLFSDQIIFLITGGIDSITSKCLELLSFSLFVIGINVPAVHYIISKGHDRFLTYSVVLGGLLDFILLLVLLPMFGLYGAIYSTVITEVFVTSILYIYSLKIFKYEK
jgi:PST family polysaccharide transporter